MHFIIGATRQWSLNRIRRHWLSLVGVQRVRLADLALRASVACWRANWLAGAGWTRGTLNRCGVAVSLARCSRRGVRVAWCIGLDSGLGIGRRLISVRYRTPPIAKVVPSRTEATPIDSFRRPKRWCWLAIFRDISWTLFFDIKFPPLILLRY